MPACYGSPVAWTDAIDGSAVPAVDTLRAELVEFPASEFCLWLIFQLDIDNNINIIKGKLRRYEILLDLEFLLFGLILSKHFCTVGIFDTSSPKHNYSSRTSLIKS